MGLMLLQFLFYVVSMCLPFMIASYILYALKKQNGAISPIF